MKTKFEWDEGNQHKSLLKHGITNQEAESAFDDASLLIFYDERHSHTEDRYICIGKSGLNNIIYSAFTIRDGKIRIISTRPANKKNIVVYEAQQ